MSVTARSFSVALPIDDRVRAMAFYQEAFGFEPIGEPAEDGVPEPLMFRTDEGALLLLVPRGGFGWVLGGGRELAEPGTSECLLGLSLATEDEVDELVARVRRAGGAVPADPEYKPWGYTALCADLDGHVWQLIVQP
jgi:predicted lactoylglutathione lyase